MKLEQAKYRAIRGWTLGNKINMKQRRTFREIGKDCSCSFTRPYLHSLTIEEYCWTAPVMSNRGLEAGKGSKHYIFPLINKEPSPGTDSRWRDTLFSHGAYYIGGFYSYNPRHIERMANWEYVDVLGVISLFDEIAIHEHGFRSNTVRIDALWVVRVGEIGISRGRLQAFLEDTYECPVTIIPRGVVNSFFEWIKAEDIDKLVEFGET